MTTSAPASASACAMPLPIPRPAPVTSATVPLRSYSGMAMPSPLVPRRHRPDGLRHGGFRREDDLRLAIEDLRHHRLGQDVVVLVVELHAVHEQHLLGLQIGAE